MNYKTTIVLGYNVFSDSLYMIDIPKNGKLIINTINPHSYVVAKRDNTFREALLDSDILLPDGVGIVYAAKFLLNEKIQRIAGYDLLLYMLKHLDNNCGKCFFLGSTGTVLETIKKRINKEYPNIKVDYFSPPFKTEFSYDENRIIINSINKFQPEVLFVGMTAPKQEKWVYQNKNKLNTKAICSIGAAFDFYAETVERPSAIWQSKGFEWLVRFLKNPIKLWQRNLISMPIFIFDLIKSKVH